MKKLIATAATLLALLALPSAAGAHSFTSDGDTACNFSGWSEYVAECAGYYGCWREGHAVAKTLDKHPVCTDGSEGLYAPGALLEECLLDVGATMDDMACACTGLDASGGDTCSSNG